VRTAAYGLLTDVWVLFPAQVEAREDGCRLALSVLKKVRDAAGSGGS
jgi:hypothetical protein